VSRGQKIPSEKRRRPTEGRGRKEPLLLPETSAWKRKRRTGESKKGAGGRRAAESRGGKQSRSGRPSQRKWFIGESDTDSPGTKQRGRGTKKRPGRHGKQTHRKRRQRPQRGGESMIRTSGGPPPKNSAIKRIGSALEDDPPPVLVLEREKKEKKRQKVHPPLERRPAKKR